MLRTLRTQPVLQRTGFKQDRAVCLAASLLLLLLQQLQLLLLLQQQQHILLLMMMHVGMGVVMGCLRVRVAVVVSRVGAPRLGMAVIVGWIVVMDRGCALRIGVVELLLPPPPLLLLLLLLLAFSAPRTGWTRRQHLHGRHTKRDGGRERGPSPAKKEGERGYEAEPHPLCSRGSVCMHLASRVPHGSRACRSEYNSYRGQERTHFSVRCAVVWTK